MRHGILTLAAASDYGPFAPHVGYVLAIVSTVTMVGFLARGPLYHWDIPDSEFPRLLRNVVGFLGAAAMVGGWFLATPSSLALILVVAVVSLVTAAVFTVRYTLLIPVYKFYKEVPNPDRQTVRQVPTLGGDTLTDEAQVEKATNNYTEQEILARVAYDADRVWPRKSRVRVMNRCAIFYVLALTLASGGVSWLAFAVQVKLTGKPAAAVIRSAEASGVEDVKISPVP